jgi:signal transduction histidine kinase
METPLTSNGSVVAQVRLSEGPAYGAAVLRSTLIGWLLAGVAAVVLAALLGWAASRRLTKPLLAITAASDKMAHGDLTVRTEVRRSDEIGSLAGSFNTMAAQMQHTISALQRFVADAAHVLGTPLTALEADLELAQSQDDRAGQQRLIGRALRQAERLERLSANLLRLSRLDTGSLRTSFEVTDIVPLVRGMADAIASRAEQAGVEFSLELSDEPVKVRVHADGLRTAVDNLVDNALKFTPEGGSVTLGAGKTAAGAQIWVEDTGIGIPPEDMDGLFGRFHRGRNVSAYPGSGLGLAIVQATMELHGGKVRAESQSGVTRFELILPQL